MRRELPFIGLALGRSSSAEATLQQRGEVRSGKCATDVVMHPAIATRPMNVFDLRVKIDKNVSRHGHNHHMFMHMFSHCFLVHVGVALRIWRLDARQFWSRN